MKKIVLCLMMMLAGLSYVSAQAKADIKFDKTTHDFGTMPVDTGAVACTFTFTNVGDAPLVIHQAWASCGCTVPEYTQEPVTKAMVYRDIFRKVSRCTPTGRLIR